MLRHNASLKVESMLQYSNTMSRPSMRRAHKETLGICRDIEIIVMTKPKTEDKKIVAIHDDFIATKDKTIGKKNFVKTC